MARLIKPQDHVLQAASAYAANIDLTLLARGPPSEYLEDERFAFKDSAEDEDNNGQPEIADQAGEENTTNSSG